MDLKNHQTIYGILRWGKRSLSWLCLPHSSTMLCSNIHAARSDILPYLNRRKPILEIGSGDEAISEAAIKLDLEPYFGVNLVGDAHALPLRNDCIGFVWLGGVLEHIAAPTRAIKEIYRVLRTDGYVYIETPFLQTVHAEPFDYQRFTLIGLEELLKSHGFSKVKSGLFSGPSAAFAHIARTYLALLFSFNHQGFFHFLYHYILGWVVFPLKYLDTFLTRYDQANIMPFAIYYLGKKG
ncbi:MAG: class I SAM-dependent methyltransferase [Patescibacteria group bacterium]